MKVKKPGKRLLAKAAWMERANIRRVGGSVFFNLLTGERCVVDADVWDDLIVPAGIAPRIIISNGEVSLGGRRLGYIVLARTKGPRPPGHVMDHLNRNKLDCRSDNLRWATTKQSGQNQGPPRRNARAMPERRTKFRYRKNVSIQVAEESAPAVIGLLQHRGIITRKNVQGEPDNKGTIKIRKTLMGPDPDELMRRATHVRAALLQARKDITGC